MFRKLTARTEWTFFSVLPKADRALAAAWWTALVLRGVLPAIFAVATGVLVGAAQRGAGLAGPLALVGGVFVLLQILTPVHQAISANLGDRTAAWLYDRLTEACVRPPGMGHLEDPSLTSDLTVARDFDLGMTGPPLAFSMDFIAGAMVEMIGGLAAAIVLAAYAWWAPIVLAGAWLSTQWLLRESGVWWDRNTPDVRAAQRDADYTYRLAVDPGPAKELRLFGLAGWTIARFVERRTRLHTLQYEATRLREKPMVWSLLIVLAANLIVFWSLASSVSGGRTSLGEVVVFAQAAVGVALLAFGGFSWALDGASAPVAAVLRLKAAMASGGALSSGAGSSELPRAASPGLPAREIRFRDVTFAYPSGPPVLEHFDLTIPAGSSIAIVGQNGAGKTTLAKLLCRLYDPQAGAIEIDGVDVREFEVASWRARVTAVFQDFPARAAAARQRRAVGRAGPDRPRRAGLGRRLVARRPRHHPRARLHRRHRSVGWAMAARGAGARAVRRPGRRHSRPARRTDRAARRARRGGNLRTDSRRNPPRDDHPHLPSFLNRATGGSNLRARTRPRDRARHARRADRARRALSDDVRSAGAAVQRGRGRGRAAV